MPLTPAGQKERRARLKLEGRPIKHPPQSPSWWRWHRYKITEEQYQQMLADQGNACGICKTSFEDGIKVCVDHCHDKKHVRGLLCNDCNVGLGRFKDDPELLEAARLFLQRVALDTS